MPISAAPALLASFWYVSVAMVPTLRTFDMWCLPRLRLLTNVVRLPGSMRRDGFALGRACVLLLDPERTV
eukprot:3257072-Rhodomonas_salina.2